MRATQHLARFLAETTYPDLPEAVTSHVKRCILDWLGVTFAGTAEPASQAIVQFVKDFGGVGESTVIGGSFRSSCVNAALANGVTGHAAELDDIHEASVIHPGAPVIPAALAIAECVEASGEEFIAAVVVGYEAGIRIAMAVMPSHYEYWHPTGTCGTFGAAAAVGKLLGLDEETIRHALGVAGTESSGLIESFGTMGKPFNAGRAARDGVTAALLAERGFTGPMSILDSAKGYANATSTQPDLEEIVDALGHRYEAANTIFKRHACCGHTHGAIDAVIDLMNENNLGPRDITEITVGTYPIAVDVVGGNYSPGTSAEAKFSLPYCVAAAVTHGSASLEAFTVEEIANPALRELMGRVKIYIGEEFSGARLGCAKVTIHTKAARVLNRRVDVPKGYPENPLTSAELKGKFRGLSRTALTAGRIGELEKTVDALEDVGNVHELTALLVE
jgi:2-methylcitrate dehydratase PrpD